MGADEHRERGQHLEQVWFAGRHGDVGGGPDERGLCDIALDWMAGRARSCGLDIDDAALGTDPRQDAPMHDSYLGLFRAFDFFERTDPLVRPIDRPNEVRKDGDRYRSNESVHGSALRRFQDGVGTTPYHATNIAAFLTRRRGRVVRLEAATAASGLSLRAGRLLVRGRVGESGSSGAPCPL